MSAHDHPTFRPVKLCTRCNRMVSKWHEHLTEKHKPIKATSPWVNQDPQPSNQGDQPSD